MLPGEMANLAAAVRQVNHNPYYGFNHDLGIVRCTKFKGLWYVAKELVIRGLGEANLRYYMDGMDSKYSP